jgi:hypothetical protein
MLRAAGDPDRCRWRQMITSESSAIRQFEAPLHRITRTRRNTPIAPNVCLRPGLTLPASSPNFVQLAIFGCEKMKPAHMKNPPFSTFSSRSFPHSPSPSPAPSRSLSLSRFLQYLPSHSLRSLPPSRSLFPSHSLFPSCSLPSSLSLLASLPPSFSSPENPLSLSHPPLLGRFQV